MNAPESLLLCEIKIDQPEPGGKTFALLWSQSQCALHVESLTDMLSSNRRAYTDDRRMDYVPIFFGSDEACHEIGKALRGTMGDRQRIRAMAPDRIQQPQEV